MAYEPKFQFDPDTQNYSVLGPSAATVAQDVALSFARDVEGKMRAALIGLGWVPPETAIPTPDAYYAACKALHHWREEAERLGKIAGVEPRTMDQSKV